MSKRPGDPGYAPGWCVHYRYNRGLKPKDPDTCEAGIDYERFRNVKQDQRPCFLNKETGQSYPNALSCPSLRLPTEKEIADHKEWLDKRMNQQGIVMVGILPWRKAHKGQNFSEVVECPCCKGRLHLSIDAYKGHVHGRCETEGCVSWIE